MQTDGFIYLIGSDEQVTEFVKTPYQDEAKFQHLLGDHLRLIPGDQVDPVEPRRDARAARRFFRRLLKSQRQEPVRLVTDKLGSYRIAHRDIMPVGTHDTKRYANNRAEVSHQPTRQRERQMRGFTSSDPAQRFLHVHGVIQNLFRVDRHRLRSIHHRMLRARSFTVWAAVTAA